MSIQQLEERKSDEEREKKRKSGKKNFSKRN